MALFCEEHGCAPAEFEERAFRACLYWRARILAPLIRLVWPNYFNTDFEFIRYLAETPGRRDAMNELAAYEEANDARGGFARRVLRIRVSSRKTSLLIERLFDRRAEGGRPVAGPQVPKRIE
jgi:hypothetical protein